MAEENTFTEGFAGQQNISTAFKVWSTLPKLSGLSVSKKKLEQAFQGQNLVDSIYKEFDRVDKEINNKLDALHKKYQDKLDTVEANYAAADAEASFQVNTNILS